MSSGSTQYILWRRDEHGNQFVVCRYHSRRQAERICQRLCDSADAPAGSDKPRYWVTVLNPANLNH